MSVSRNVTVKIIHKRDRENYIHNFNKEPKSNGFPMIDLGINGFP